MPLNLITREEWGAKLPRWAPPNLKHPLKYIAVNYVTSETKVPGAEAVKYLQERDLVSGQADIQTNFLIAEDGKVFEGRGWFTQAGDQDNYPGVLGEFLEITYLGEFSNEPLNHPVFQSTRSLLEVGLKEGYVLKTAQFIDADDQNEKMKENFSNLLASVNHSMLPAPSG